MLSLTRVHALCLATLLAAIPEATSQGRTTRSNFGLYHLACICLNQTKITRKRGEHFQPCINEVRKVM